MKLLALLLLTAVPAPAPPPRQLPRCCSEECKCTRAGHECTCGKQDRCDCVIAVTEDADGRLEAKPVPPPPDPYPHLPPVAACRANMDLAAAWAAAILRDAHSLGYYSERLERVWGFAGAGFAVGINHKKEWHGGGWCARAMQEEYADTRLRERVWCLAVALREDEEKDDFEAELRALIGDANYVRGQLPPPIPTWRVPRR